MVTGIVKSFSIGRFGVFLQQSGDDAVIRMEIEIARAARTIAVLAILRPDHSNRLQHRCLETSQVHHANTASTIHPLTPPNDAQHQ